jgi:tRNA(Arg) A34 adenosine deaminase TadA
MKDRGVTSVIHNTRGNNVLPTDHAPKTMLREVHSRKQNNVDPVRETSQLILLL